MRKAILFISLLLISISSSAQKFECKDYVVKQAQWNKTMLGSNKKWAKEAIKQFPLDTDGDIYYKYTVLNNCNKTTSELMTLGEGFLKSILNLDKGAGLKVDTVNNTCYGEGGWSNVGQVLGVYNATTINAELKIRIKINKDSIIFETKVPHYILGACDLFKGGTESGLISPGKAFPANLDSDHKEAYAQSFINCNAYSYNTMSNFLNYLNTHKDTKNIDVW